MARLGWVASALVALAVACGGGGGGGDAGGGSPGGGDPGGDPGPGGGGDTGGVAEAPIVRGAFSFYGTAQGLSADVRDVSADEGGNVYVAAWDALHVKARGAAAFTRVDAAAAGLSATCWPASEIKNPSPPGAPGVCPIISVAGAGPGTAVVGYKGVGIDDDYDGPWALDSGGADVVRLEGESVTRVRRVFVASPPQTVCEHWADAPLNTVCSETWSDSVWMAGRKKMRQIQRIVVNHDASRPLSYGDVYMGGTHGSLAILVANPAAREWEDKTEGHPAFADARHVWEHHHPNPPSVDGNQFLAGESWALALHPLRNVPFYANQFRIGSMPFYASMPRPTTTNNWWGDQDPPEPGLLALWYPAVPQNPDLRDNVQSLSFCDDGTLWAGSAEHGLARIAPDGSVSYVDLPPNLGNSALAVACDPSDGSVWVGFGWGGFGRWSGTWWTIGTDAPRFAWQSPVRSIQIDRWSSPRVVYLAHTSSRFGPGGVTAYDGP